jgi:quinol-cytochrome oxidoreductase complex cytochrome b subunit
MSTPPGQEEESKLRRPMKFLPDFLLRDLFGWTLALALLATLAAFFPWELGDKADPFAPAFKDIKPEWYFMFMFETLKVFPGGEIFGIEYEAIPILAFSLAGALLLLVPFLDRGVTEKGRSPVFTVVGVLAVAYMAAMTAWGYRSLVPIYVVALTALLAFFLSIGTRRTPPR